MDVELKLTIGIILICTILMSVGFIYSTYDDELSSEPNAFTGLVYTRSEAYFIFSFVSLMIMTLFWGFVYFAGKSMK